MVERDAVLAGAIKRRSHARAGPDTPGTTRVPREQPADSVSFARLACPRASKNTGDD